MHGMQVSLEQSAGNICARNNSAGIRCALEARVLVSGVPGHMCQEQQCRDKMCTGSQSACIRSAGNICARNHSAGIRCAWEASVLGSAMP